jgi:thioredoxin 1
MAQYAKYKSLGETAIQQGPIAPECPKIISLSHKQKLIQTNKICVIDIYGDWCSPCKAIAPKFYEMAQNYTKPGFCVLVKENVDDEITKDLDGVPAFDFYVDGKKVHRITGADIKSVEEKLLEIIGYFS